MTDQQFLAWLKNPAAIRCILVEVEVKLNGGGVITRYLSDRGYVTKSGDTPANTVYSPVVAGGVKFTESLSLDGDVTLSYGDIELNNVDGKIDSWLDDYWTNRPATVFIGDMTWPRSDFRQIFGGVVTGIDSRKRDRINIKLSDKLQRLNAPATEAKLGGSSSNADKLIPLCFGECHNIEPLLVNQSLHEYQVHDGPIERIIEVRDNGVPVSFTPFLSTGKFRLVNNPVGQITASVQGDKPSTYANDVVSLVKRLASGYGVVSQRFSESEFDNTSLTSFKTANPQPVGIYMSERKNVLEACNELASSIGARLVISKTGLLSLVKLHLPQSSAGTSVSSADMTDRSLEVSQMPVVQAGVKIGYCKNWTVQTTLAAGVIAEHASMFAEEYLSITRTDTAAAANYNTFTEPKLDETLLLTAADALAEANRRLDLFSVQRKVIKYKGYANLMLESLGNPQTITHTRFGLSGGVTGQIVSVVTDWANQRVEIEVLI